jgi:hypothetical protein
MIEVIGYQEAARHRKLRMDRRIVSRHISLGLGRSIEWKRAAPGPLRLGRQIEHQVG